MRNLTITAEQAVDWGLASRLVPADSLRSEARRVAEEVAALHPGSIRRTKLLLREGGLEVGARLKAEHREFCAQVTTEEARQGMAVFLGICE